LNSTGAAVPNQNFQWELGDGTSSQDSSFTHVFNLPGVYSIKLKLNTDKACADSSNSQVEILDDPEASFSFTNTAIATYSFEATDTNLTSYLWNFGDGNTDTSFNVIHIYATNGSYPVTLEVSDTNTCVDSSSQSIQLENVGLGVLSNLGFVIYPNPSSGEVYLKNLNAEYGEMKIYDQLGKVISNIAISSAERQIELPILSVGTYIVEIRASSFYRSKLVVH
jgi:PKD repeat protein